MKKASFLSCFLVLALVSCGRAPATVCAVFGTLESGDTARIWHLENTSGASLDLTDYGARIVRIVMPDRYGRYDDVAVGYGTLSSFEKGDRFIGPVIGRYGNRIDHASFILDGKEYVLDANESFDGEPVQCHGGNEGFDRKIWRGSVLSGSGSSGVRFSRLSPDGEGGFPGNLETSVTYWLTEDDRVVIEYEAMTDAPTVVNLSNHTYFNLKGSSGGYVMDHLLRVEADSCIQNNRHFCPDLVLGVDGSPFDFRTPQRVDYRLDMENEHLRIMHGMSACWLIRGYDGSLRLAADLYDRGCGRGVQTWTTEPSILTFTGRTFSGDKYPDGKYGPIEKYSGMLLETIHLPDSPNQPRFPSTVLRPGEKYYSRTEYRFYTK